MNILSLPRYPDPQSIDTVFVIASQTDQQTYGLTWDALVLSLSEAITGGAAGDTQQIQYNELGVFAADANFRWDSGASELNITGGIVVTIGNITAPSFNGVALSILGDATNYLDETGNYSAIANPVGGDDSEIQFNSNGVFDGSANLTWNSTGLTVGGATGFLDAALFNGIALTTAGAATNYLDASGNYSAPISVPAGSDTQLQFNDNGVMGSSPNLTWDNITSSVNALKFSGVELKTSILPGSEFLFLKETGNYGLVQPAQGAAADNQIIFNDNGFYNSNAIFTYDGTTLDVGFNAGGAVTADTFNGVGITNTGNSAAYLAADGQYNFPAAFPPNGANYQVQFNDNGAFGIDADFTWDGVVLNSGLDHIETARISTPLILENNEDDYQDDQILGGTNTIDIDTSVAPDGTYNAGGAALSHIGPGTGLVIEIIVSGGIVVGTGNIISLGDGKYKKGQLITIDAANAPFNGSGTATFEIDAIGFQDANLFRLESDNNNYRISGFEAPAAGVNRIITIMNIGTAGDRVDLRNNDGGSDPENRMLLRNNLNVEDDEFVRLWYDPINLRWRAIGEGI